jgi:hypothetical protein
MIENPGAIEIAKFVRFSTDSRILWAQGVASDDVSMLCPSGFPYFREDREQFAQHILSRNLSSGIPALQAFFRTISLDIGWISGGRLTPLRHTFFVEAAAFLMDLSGVLSTSSPLEAKSFSEVLLELFVGQPNSESALEWPSDLSEDFQLSSGQLQHFRIRTIAAIKNRVLFQSANRLMGLGPPGTVVGDDICVLIGYPALFILRKVASRYILLGECFVLGLMDSESLRDILRSPQEFEIH